MTSGISLHSAEPSDAASAIRVLRASITELCVIDHQNDPETLRRWLNNKTPEQFASWLADPELSVVIAELDGEPRGVGSLARSGKINLCYVEPGFERRGIGRALLVELETRAHSLGLAVIDLDSTLAARAFYERNGYVSLGEPTRGFGRVRCYPYRKTLPAAG